MKLSQLIIFVLLLVYANSHSYDCVFDKTNQDLKAESAKVPSDKAVRYNVNGRLMTPSRSAIRITLNYTSFNTIIAGNGVSNTTTANLDFILNAMLVAVNFYMNRLQVLPTSQIVVPSTCVDYSTPANDQNPSIGIANSDLHIYVLYLTDPTITYGATGKSCKYFAGSPTPSSSSADPDVAYGRPTVGRIKFNTYNLVDTASSLTNQLFQSVASTALHETMHILGFDVTLYSTYLTPAGLLQASTLIVNSSAINSNRPPTNLLKTPNVLAWAQEWFGCSTLIGMPLQNQDGAIGGGGSHWERVAMYDQLMTGTSFGAQKGFSGLTFALLNDMGWYTVDNSFSQSSNYGYQKGCSFLMDACYSNVSNTFGYFCDPVADNGISLCESDFFSKAVCSNQSALMSDYCAMYGPYLNCVDPTVTDSNDQAVTFEVYGTSSFCVSGTLGTVALPSVYQSRCYPFVCETSSIVFTIGAYIITCLSSQAGVSKTLSSLTGSLVCPNFNDFCVISRKTCPNWCSQNGFCMGGICNCNTGFSGDDCSQSSCTSGNFYNPTGSGSCGSSCPSGYYQNIYDKSCDLCKSPCANCLGSPTACTNCLSTIANPQYFYNGSCLSACPSNTFVSGTTCSLCSTASYCLTCSGSSTTCTSCTSGYYLLGPTGTTCVSNCASTAYPLTDVVNNICKSVCDLNLVAVGGSTCNLCSNGTYKNMLTSSCTNNCPNNTYADSVKVECISCDSSCATCNGAYAENCTSCVSTSALKYILLSMCWSICPKGFFANDTAGACQVCNVNLQCSSCVLTSGVVQCTICNYGYYFQVSNSTCNTGCNNYQFQNAWNHSCSDCDPLCGNCNGPTNSSCTDCRGSNYLLLNSTGGYCLSTCPSNGYVPSGTICQACDSTCLTCNGGTASKCVTCASGYYFYSGYCRYVCPNGTYPDPTQYCLSCNSNCTYCFGSSISQCTSCKTGMYLSNFTCGNSCPAGSPPNQWGVCYSSFTIYCLFLAIIFALIV